MDLQGEIQVRHQVATEKMAMSPSTRKERVKKGRKERGRASRKNDVDFDDRRHR